jgi:hypothetical protein
MYTALSQSQATPNNATMGSVAGFKTVTLTFAECVENHIGNEQIGTKMSTGPSTKDLYDTVSNMKSMYPSLRIDATVVELSKPYPNIGLDASVLLIKNLRAHDHADVQAMFQANWDSKYYDTRRSTVLNKNARHNLCFTDANQEPDYETGRGRTYAFSRCPTFMSNLRSFFSNTLMVDGRPYMTQSGGKPLFAEGNLYYDHSKTYIGWHGDVERSIVVGYRMGATFPLHFMLFGPDQQPVPGSLHTFHMSDSDAYIMSHDATGYNWRKHAYAYRHSAGHSEVLNKTQKHQI